MNNYCKWVIKIIFGETLDKINNILYSVYILYYL